MGSEASRDLEIEKIYTYTRICIICRFRTDFEKFVIVRVINSFITFSLKNAREQEQKILQKRFWFLWSRFLRP